MMNKYKSCNVVKSIGIFSDENNFKKKFMTLIENNPEEYKTILAIENSVEPGMPDLIIIDRKDRATFVEIKYARKGVITFKRTQIPWYRRHSHLSILVVAYNDVTTNVHVITGKNIARIPGGLSCKLANEETFDIIEELV
jgi:hypothetical protein